MLEYTRIEPPMEIRTAGATRYGTAQGILLVVVRGTDDVLKTVKLLIVLVPGLKRDMFSSLAGAKKSVNTIIENNGSYHDLGPFIVQLTRLDSMDHLDLTIVKESKIIRSAFCAISGDTFGKESVLTALVPKKSVAPSVGSINVDQRVIKNTLVEDKNEYSTYEYEIHENTNDKVSFREQIEKNTRSPTIDDIDKKARKNSDVNRLKQVQTSYIHKQ